MEVVKLLNIRDVEELSPLISQLKHKLEERINLEEYLDGLSGVNVTKNLLQRLTLMVGLCQEIERSTTDLETLKFSNSHIHDTVFLRNDFPNLWSSLLKIRWNSLGVDWNDNTIKSRIVCSEMIRGCEFLLDLNNLEYWLNNSPANINTLNSKGEIPLVNLQIGNFEDNIAAYLDINSLSIPNTQIIISGSTGSGKTNLLVLLINQIREATVESNYPINFLLFDYKGEFSNEENNLWLEKFEVDRKVIIDPMLEPLPFSPFKDFTEGSQKEIDLYATELTSALLAIDKTSISAIMSNRLSQAVINSYKSNVQAPIDFKMIYDNYTELQEPNKQEEMDSIKSLLSQLMRQELFSFDKNKNIVNNNFIIKLDAFPKDGAIAKAIVYFTISALNNQYEKLSSQTKSDTCVEIRHFTVIDEAHYMLEFDNRPLRNLIAVGRNKGLSIIFATQSMDSYKTKDFDFYQNAQYPLIMKQQSISDKIIKDFFGVNGNEFQELKSEISNLGKGEVIMKNNTAYTLGMGKKYKKILVSHII